MTQFPLMLALRFPGTASQAATRTVALAHAKPQSL